MLKYKIEMKRKFFITLAIIASSIFIASAQNPTLETIFNRKSVRSYTDQPVSVDDLMLLVKAGMAAPTGMNRQPWEFFIIQDKELMASLADKIPYARMLKEAQAAIVVMGNPEKSIYWYLDCSAAAQNILLQQNPLVWELSGQQVILLRTEWRQFQKRLEFQNLFCHYALFQ